MFRNKGISWCCNNQGQHSLISRHFGYFFVIPTSGNILIRLGQCTCLFHLIIYWNMLDITNIQLPTNLRTEILNSKVAYSLSQFKCMCQVERNFTRDCQGEKKIAKSIFPTVARFLVWLCETRSSILIACHPIRMLPNGWHSFPSNINTCVCRCKTANR